MKRCELGLDWVMLRRAVLVLAPIVAWGLIYNADAWLQVAVITIATFIVHERAATAPLGVVLHTVVILFCCAALLLAQPYPLPFVVLCALSAMASVRISVRGAALRFMGNFTFAPALYLAVDTYERAKHSGPAVQLTHFVPILCAGALPTLVLASWEHARRALRKEVHWKYFVHVLRPADRGPEMTSWLPVVAIAVAVALAAVIAEVGHLPHAQWAIWSAATVVGSDASAAREKWRDRSVGALAGVPVGLTLGTLLPHQPFTVDWCVIGSLLSLVAFRSYTFGFASRSALAVAALCIAGAGTESAVARVSNVVLGGYIGFVCSIAVAFLVSGRKEQAGVAKRRQGEDRRPKRCE